MHGDAEGKARGNARALPRLVVFTCLLAAALQGCRSAQDYRKEADETDRRRSRLYLTEKGDNAAERMRRSFEDRDARITAALTPEKEKELIGLLDRIRACLEEETVC